MWELASAMPSVTLAHSTGNHGVDACLAATIALIEAVFPDRMRAYYLLGSYADYTAVPDSDVDLFVVSRAPLRPEQHRLYHHVACQCSILAGLRFDTGVVDENDLGGRPVLATARLLLYGEDVSALIPPLQLTAVARKAVSSALYVLSELQGRPAPLVLPLTYPDPHGEFYGYERQGMPVPEGWEGPGTKKLVNAVSMAAGALVTITTGQPVTCRRECVPLYRTLLHDQWTDFVTEVCALRSPQQGYALPTEATARQRLRHLCAQIPAFGAHFLLQVRAYLLRQLDSADAAHRAWAEEHLALVRDPGSAPPTP
jgi:hypothetical protein